MKTLNKKLTAYTALAWVIAILALLFRLCARLLSYDADIGYFKTNALFPTLYYASLGLLVCLAASALFVFRGTKLPESVLVGMKTTCIAEKIAAMIGSLCMLGVSVFMLMFFWVNKTILPTGFTVFGVITAVLSIFFFLFFWIPASRGKALHIFSSYALILHFLYILGFSYFELYTQMNSPVKLLLQVTAIAAIFFLLTDIRFRLDTARPARFLFSSILVIGFSSISVLSDPFFSVATKEYTTVYHVCNVVNLALLVYAGVRLMRLLALCSKVTRSLPEEDEALPSADEGTESAENDNGNVSADNEDEIETETKNSDRQEADK